MAVTMLILGVFGLLGLSVLFPLIALPSHYLRLRNTQKSGGFSNVGRSPQHIEIIIPAHNEAQVIGMTLESIHRAIQHAGAKASQVKIRVHADGCSDGTAAIAHQSPAVSVTESQENRSKWVTIKEMIAESSADWTILVDAGTIWPDMFLTNFIQVSEQEPNALALAPTYRPLKAGWVARTLWQVETTFKKMEALSGGPISVHGATVGYRTPALQNVLNYLRDQQWLNDDVVIPLLMRALYPAGVILYPVGQVFDSAVQSYGGDIQRRKRILRGNVQWTRSLLLDCFRWNGTAGLIAGRRLFRMFWAYWIGLIALAMALTFPQGIVPLLALTTLLWILSGSFRQLVGAAMVSLLVPYSLLVSDRKWRFSWK